MAGAPSIVTSFTSCTRYVRYLQAEAGGLCLYSGGADGTLRTWAVRDIKLQRKIELGSAVSLLRHQRDSVLVAACCDDLGVRVVDAVTNKVVRRYTGHTNTVTDLAWSPDGR